METLKTIILDKKSELERYSRRSDAKPYVLNKLREQIAVLENCVDLNDSGVDNQLRILIHDMVYKAMTRRFSDEHTDDALIIGIRLTDNPEIRRVGLADLIYTKALKDPQQGLWEVLQISEADEEAIACREVKLAPSYRYRFDLIMEGLEYKI